MVRSVKGMSGTCHARPPHVANVGERRQAPDGRARVCTSFHKLVIPRARRNEKKNNCSVVFNTRERDSDIMAQSDAAAPVPPQTTLPQCGSSAARSDHTDLTKGEFSRGQSPTQQSRQSTQTTQQHTQEHSPASEALPDATQNGVGVECGGRSASV